MDLRDSLRQFPGQRLRRFFVSGYLLATAHHAASLFLHAWGPDFLVGLGKKTRPLAVGDAEHENRSAALVGKDAGVVLQRIRCGFG